MKNFKMKKFVITFLAVFALCVVYQGVNGVTEAKAANNMKEMWRVDVEASLIVRDKASTKGNIIGSLCKNSVVVGKDQGNGWIKLQATNSKGKEIDAYISKKYVKTMQRNFKKIRVTDNTLYSRSIPTVKGKIINKYKKGDFLSVNTACSVKQDGYIWNTSSGKTGNIYLPMGNGSKVEGLEWIPMQHVK